MALPTAQDLARTYDPPSYEDAWACVTDYQRVLEHAADHPEQRSSAVSSRLDLPRGRIRPWLNGARPDVVRGVQTAEANGWIANHETRETERALVQLAAWVLSGGSLHLGDAPHVYFSLNHDDGHFEQIAAAAGIDYNVVARDSEARGTEARPTTDGAVLARVLAAMDVPSDATAKQNAVSLPEFVDGLDSDLREAFARIYVLNRGAQHAHADTIEIHEDRPETYLEDVAELLRSVTGERITRSGKSVSVSAAAARKLTASD